jgi:hypothetical protein
MNYPDTITDTKPYQRNLKMFSLYTTFSSPTEIRYTVEFGKPVFEATMLNEVRTHGVIHIHFNLIFFDGIANYVIFCFVLSFQRR